MTTSPIDDQLEPDPALDPRAQDLLDAFRTANAAPVPTRERVWARVEQSTGGAARLGARVAKGAGVLAVLGGLAWLAWPRPQPEAEHAWTVPETTPAAPAEPSAAPPEEPAPAPVAVAVPAPAPPPDPEADEAEAPTKTKPAPREQAKTAPKPEPKTEPDSDTDTGPTELELIARAKKALARGDAKATLAATEDHARRFPSGMLVEERALLEIEARCALGQHERVERLRGAFLNAHADSPLADRVRHSCKEND